MTTTTTTTIERPQETEQHHPMLVQFPEEKDADKNGEAPHQAVVSVEESALRLCRHRPVRFLSGLGRLTLAVHHWLAGPAWTERDRAYSVRVRAQADWVFTY